LVFPDAFILEINNYEVKKKGRDQFVKKYFKVLEMVSTNINTMLRYFGMEEIKSYIGNKNGLNKDNLPAFLAFIIANYERISVQEELDSSDRLFNDFVLRLYNYVTKVY
jgi:hypothetical protein